MIDENPYASPMDFREADSPSTKTVDPRSLALRPRWWDVVVFVVLVIGSAGILGTYLLEGRLHGSNLGGLIRVILFALLYFATVVGISGGLIVARGWRQGKLLVGPSPGHALLLGTLAGAVFQIPFVALARGGGMLGLELPISLVLIGLGIIGMIPSGVFFALTPLKSRWILAASLFLALAFVGFALMLFQAFTMFGFPGEAMNPWWHASLSQLSYVGWILAAGCLLSIAFHEHRSVRITRDWLHWTGVVCWSIAIITRSGFSLVQHLPS